MSEAPLRIVRRNCPGSPTAMKDLRLKTFDSASSPGPRVMVPTRNRTFSIRNQRSEPIVPTRGRGVTQRHSRTLGHRTMNRVRPVVLHTGENDNNNNHLCLPKFSSPYVSRLNDPFSRHHRFISHLGPGTDRRPSFPPTVPGPSLLDIWLSEGFREPVLLHSQGSDSSPRRDH